MPTLTPNPQTPSPFFDLLAGAEEIKIREVPPEPVAANGEENTRTFLVHIRNKPAPPPAPPAPELNPENRLYMLKSAELLVGDSDFVLARNLYSYLLKMNLRDADAMKGLGVCFFRLGEIVSAKKCFKAHQELGGGDSASVWLAQCLVAEGNDAGAMNELASVRHPESLDENERFELFKELGNCRTRAGELDVARGSYQRAMELQPDSDVIHVNLGTLELQRNNLPAAEAYFQRGLFLNPKSSRAHCGIGLAAQTRNDLATAQKQFERALDLDAQNMVALFQLVALTALGINSAPVRDRLQRFLQKDGRNAEARYALAVLLFREGDWTSCEREVDQVLAADSQNAKARALKEQLTSNKHRPQ